VRRSTEGSPPVRLGEIVVIGGGCYGTFYARQLADARARGRMEFTRVLVVDWNPQCRMVKELGETEDRRLVVREWGTFFDEYFASAGTGPEGSTETPPHHIVPSPLMPPLMHQWLLRRARARWPGRPVDTRPLVAEVGTPYDTPAPDGTRYVSFADWICPTHCIEPAICPVIRGPRTWEMSDAAEGLARRLHARGPVLFVCRHQAFGVGTFAVNEVLAGDRIVADAGASGAPVQVLIGTVSSCHGALALLDLGAV
jgi:hypothetical protein